MVFWKTAPRYSHFVLPLAAPYATSPLVFPRYVECVCVTSLGFERDLHQDKEQQVLNENEEDETGSDAV